MTPEQLHLACCILNARNQGFYGLAEALTELYHRLG